MNWTEIMIFYISATGRFLNSSPSHTKLNEYIIIISVYCILNIMVHVHII